MDRRRGYLDSSVVLRRLLRHPDALEELTGWNLVASELMEVEALRTLYRVHSQGHLSDEDLGTRIAELRECVASLEVLPITIAVLKRAGGHLPGVLKTQYAIHLATALLWSEQWGETIVILTHGRQLAKVARLSGLEVYPEPTP